MYLTPGIVPMFWSLALILTPPPLPLHTPPPPPLPLTLLPSPQDHYVISDFHIHLRTQNNNTNCLYILYTSSSRLSINRPFPMDPIIIRDKKSSKKLNNDKCNKILIDCSFIPVIQAKFKTNRCQQGKLHLTEPICVLYNCILLLKTASN